MLEIVSDKNKLYNSTERKKITQLLTRNNRKLEIQSY